MGKYFSSENELYSHFQPFFETLLKHPDVGQQLRDKQMSFRFVTRDPAGEIALDAREGSGVVRTGGGEKKEDVHISLQADLMHKLMLGKIRLMPAIMGRQISARGLMDKQKELGAMIATLSQIYKDYLNANQKQHMIE